MTGSALFAVLPYGAGSDGTLVACPPIEAFSAADAREKARRVASDHAGVVAIAQLWNPDDGRLTSRLEVLYAAGRVPDPTTFSGR
ncbi:hypothetical protein [Segnochrobactrum spirostomi]|uniref:Uncharacterized protein n=1 Tax=Segnochrobactrum spirostomi TaxID=2608987 RepID=A0A6A7Y0J8_9HYPH|nr:hypothetical protein [Segnochrobactrum spirostomi]MQT11927.1 hypothetical protein [Segnochrobactrum spirostomi]